MSAELPNETSETRFALKFFVYLNTVCYCVPCDFRGKLLKIWFISTCFVTIIKADLKTGSYYLQPAVGPCCLQAFYTHEKKAFIHV